MSSPGPPHLAKRTVTVLVRGRHRADPEEMTRAILLVRASSPVICRRPGARKGQALVIDAGVRDLLRIHRDALPTHGGGLAREGPVRSRRSARATAVLSALTTVVADDDSVVVAPKPGRTCRAHSRCRRQG